MIKQNIKLTFLSVFLFLFITVNAQFTYNYKVDSLLNETLQFNINRQNLANVAKTNNNGLLLWVQAYNYFLEYNYGKLAIDRKEYLSYTNHLLSELKSFNKESEYYNACIADVYLFSSYTYILAGEYYYGWRSLVKAQRYIEKNLKEYPGSYLNLRHQYVLLLVDYLIYNNLPLNFSEKVVSLEKELVDVQGKILSDNDQPLSLKRESIILAVFIQKIIHYGHDQKMTIDVNESWAAQGPLETLAFLKALSKKESHKAKSILQNAFENGYMEKCNLLNLELANNYSFELNDSALYFYQKYCEQQKGVQYLVYANHRIGWHYFINDNNQFPDQLELIKALEPKSDLDKQAFNDIQNVKNWDKHIIKSRLLFDGANYNKALSILLGIENSLSEFNDDQKVEYFYRLARIYDELDENSKALIYYNKVISSGKQNKFYFPVYSAFFSGQIYERNKNCEMALVYYEYCLKLDSPIYKESIHHRAQNGKDRCDSK